MMRACPLLLSILGLAASADPPSSTPPYPTNTICNAITNYVPSFCQCYDASQASTLVCQVRAAKDMDHPANCDPSLNLQWFPLIRVDQYASRR